MATVELFSERTKLSEQDVVKILVGILEMEGVKKKGMILCLVRTEKCIKA